MTDQLRGAADEWVENGGVEGRMIFRSLNLFTPKAERIAENTTIETHEEVIEIRPHFVPAKKSVIASFKVRIKVPEIRGVAYVHQIKTYEQKDGRVGYACSQYCGEGNPFSTFKDPCVGMRLAESIVGEIAKSPETAVGDLRAFIANGGNIQTLVDKKREAK